MALPRTFENGQPRYLEGTTTVRLVEGVAVPTDAVQREDGTHELREDGGLIVRES